MFVLKYAHPARRKSSHGQDSKQPAMKSSDGRDSRSRGEAEIKEYILEPTLSRPVTIPCRKPSRPADNRRMSSRRTSTSAQSNTRCHEHDRNALSPAVAALLAVTAIPVRKTPKRRSEQRRISIDELVQQWRTEARSSPSCGSHRTLDILLDVPDESPEASVESLPCSPSTPTTQRTSSSESVPSLDTDGRSVLSLEDPPTPTSIRAKRGSVSFLKSKARSASLSKDCAFDHPLIRGDDAHGDCNVSDDIELITYSPDPSSHNSFDSSAAKSKASFTSNLTLSLQSLKTRALSSLANFTLNTASNQQPSAPKTYKFSDEQLWSHPYIFPRLTAEVRPSPFSGTPTESQRRYLNPTARHRQSSPPPSPTVATSPSYFERKEGEEEEEAEEEEEESQWQLSLEEQQQHYRAALHSPERNVARGEPDAPAKGRSPLIQLVTYTRTPAPSRTSTSTLPHRRRSLNRLRSSTQRAVQAGSEAGVAQQETVTTAGEAVPTRHREPRENGAFLHVFALEMNMRRAGKLEDGAAGKARMWLPPRKGVTCGGAEAANNGAAKGRTAVPFRWVGLAVDDA